MKEIIGFIKLYFKEVNKPFLIFCTLFSAVLVFCNYHFKLEYNLIHSFLPYPEIGARWLIYSIAFLLPYLILVVTGKKKYLFEKGFFVCLLLAPLIFALKAGMDTYIDIDGDPHWNSYWNDILYWPLRVLLMVMALFFLWRWFHQKENFYGLTTQKMKFKPYLLMLLVMVPLITAASTQADFLIMYPKMSRVLPLPGNAHPGWWYKLLFELSYGSDFFSIETFFRGFLVIGFAKWVGKDAILPMACFYCTIHFGKPLGECISSYFGGLLLGIVSYNTKSVYGGLMVHLGIAWMMELGGYLGHVLTW